MNNFAYPAAARWRSARTIQLLAGVAVVALGCKAGVVASNGKGGAGGAGPGAGGAVGTAGTTGTGGSSGPGLGGFGGIVTNPDAGACQQANYTCEPKIPTVYLVVDRSGSMFHCLSTSQPVCTGNMADTSWSKLKDAIE